mgnify:CR=1 FL=1
MYKRLQRNINLLYTFNFLKGLKFFIPIFALYLQQELFTVFNVTLILAVQSVATLVFEIPSGAIADLFGRKKTLIASSIIAIIALLFLSFGQSLTVFIIYAILIALAESLISGTDTAILFDSIKGIERYAKKNAIAQEEASLGKKEAPILLDEIKKLPKFKKVISISNSMWPIGASISSAIGGFLAAYSLKLPIIITIIPFILALLITFFLVEPKYVKEKHKSILTHIFKSTKIVIKKKQVLLLSLAGLLFYAFGEVAHQLNPIFFQFKDISVELFGIIFAVTFGLSFLGSFFSHNVSEKIGNKKTIILAAIVSPFLIYGATLAPGIWAAVLIVSASLFWGLKWPVISHLLNLEVKSKNRATVISIGNLARKLGFAIFVPFFGYFVDLYDVNIAFKLAGVLSFIVVFLLLFLKDKD